ncbi:Universal stress protein family protein [Hydrogenophaga sp. T4]|nr:Universal stress protein family protein [Hydrogenophaga sp. T4]
MSGKPSGDGPKQIEWARQTLEQAGFGVVADIEPGDPETVIGHAIQKMGVDLLVMGAYTHSPLRKLFMGSKTTELLRAARYPRCCCAKRKPNSPPWLTSTEAGSQPEPCDCPGSRLLVWWGWLAEPFILAHRSRRQGLRARWALAACRPSSNL